MFLISKGYAKLWHLDPKERYTDVRFSTSEKDNREGHEGEYINSNWTGRMIGKAHEKAKDLEGKERIEIHSAKITNIYSKEKEKSYLNVAIFDFDVQGGSSEGSGKSSSKMDEPPVTDEDDDETMPF